MFNQVKQSFINWISTEPPNTDYPLCDFERIRYEVRPCDVLLIEGRSRVSQVIKQITQSPWSHACLYIGRLHDVDDINLRKKLAEHFNGSPNVQLVIEGYLGQGTIASPLESYQCDHIRICRPRGLSRQDAQNVIAYAIEQLGTEYDVRQIFDLARFLVPWSFLPGRFRSSLFEMNIGESTKTVCSTMIAKAFTSVEFPILPVVKQHEETGIELIKTNPKLYTPRDFDYSPFFEIIKYPFIELSDHGNYRNLPWNRNGLFSPDGENIVDSTNTVRKKAKEAEPQTDAPLEKEQIELDVDNESEQSVADALEQKDTPHSSASADTDSSPNTDAIDKSDPQLTEEVPAKMSGNKENHSHKGILNRFTPMKKTS